MQLRGHAPRLATKPKPPRSAVAAARRAPPLVRSREARLAVRASKADAAPPASCGATPFTAANSSWLEHDRDAGGEHIEGTREEPYTAQAHTDTLRSRKPVAVAGKGPFTALSVIKNYDVCTPYMYYYLAHPTHSAPARSEKPPAGGVAGPTQDDRELRRSLRMNQDEPG